MKPLPLKAVTVAYPWAAAFTVKQAENRTWRPPRNVVGGFLALHAGKLPTSKDRQLQAAHEIQFIGSMRGTEIDPTSIPVGCVFAVARVLGWASMTSADDYTWDAPNLDPDEVARILKSGWAFGPQVWLLSKAIWLPEPISCKGAQGLWNLPDQVQRAVMAQVKAKAIELLGLEE